MPNVEIYTTSLCPYCVSAKQLLERKGIAYREINLTSLSTDELNRQMLALSGRRTVPQIVINGRSIGGYTDLRRLEDAGELDRLLRA
ncbi:MAG: glutaredoxin 3 [Armatimonadetes bacterium]|nr:glutaredoxin 3 [Armatimonadota bacterium]